MSENDTDLSIEELRRQTEQTDRSSERVVPGEERLETEMVAAFERIEAGETSKTLSVRDEQLAALLHALENDPDGMDDVGRALQRETGRDETGGVDRSEVLRLAVRCGLQQAAPDLIETGRSAHAEHVKNRF